ncbi:MAG TPA: TonB-dependent receptor [Pyrinomonadaceae bacterium]|nr:TonB-dependent receptor [Pyrinomonadaceae bacterium]
MRRQRFAFVLVLIAIGVVSVSAQDKSVPIYGKVTDPNGEPIQHASVEFESDGNTTRTLTDLSGDFTVFSARAYGILSISSPGFSTVKIKVNAEKYSLRIRLYPAVINERVVVSAPITYEERIPPTSSSQFNVGTHEIASAGALTIDDVLRQVPGFSLFRRSGGLTTNPTAQGVSLRGVGASGASRALVLLDGVPLNSPFGGWVYWNRVPRVNIENVSVQNGASSSLYGSGALGGVVNITSDTRWGTGLDVLASAGNKGTAVTSFSGGKILGDWAIVAAGEALHTNGYVLVPGNQRGAVDTAAGTGDLGGSVTVSNVAHGFSFLRLSSFGESRQNGTPIQVNDTRISSIDFGLDSTLPKVGPVLLRLYGSSETFNQNFSAVAADRESESLTNRQRNPSQQVGFVFQATPNIGYHQVLRLGVEGREVRGHSAETTFNNSRVTAFVDAGGRQRSIGVFANDSVYIGSWQFGFGGRVDHWLNSRGFSNRTPVVGTPTLNAFADRTETAFSPRLWLSKRFDKGVEVSASAYRAFRAPTLNELYRNFRVGNVVTNANADLSAERLTGGEAGIGFNPFEGLFVRGNVFWSDIDDSIANVTLTTTPALITRQRQNLGAIRARGAELSAVMKINFRWEVSGEYMLTDSTVLRFPANRALEGLMVPQVPRHQFNFQVTYSGENWLVSTQGRFVSRQFDDDQNLLPLARFFTLDAEVTRRISEKLRLFVAFQNLTGSRYEISSTPVFTVGPPVLVRGGVRVMLK